MSIFRKLFRPGSGGPQKGISIVDTPHGRARIRNPVGNRTREDEINPEGTFYPFILTNQFNVAETLMPEGRLPGVDREGNIPRYERDDPSIYRRLFGIDIGDD